jgi:hypothetical protein
MTPDPAAIEQYIKANRGTYADQAIREKLISVGHDPAAIDEAFGRLGVAVPSEVDTRPRPATGLVGFAWSLFVISGLIGLAGFGFNGPDISVGSAPIFVLAFGGVGLALILLLRWAIPRFGISGGGAWLIGLGLLPAFFALLYGSCAASFITRA